MLGEFKTDQADEFWDYTIRYLRNNPLVNWTYMTIYTNPDSSVMDFPLYDLLKGDLRTVKHNWKTKDL